MLQEPKTNLRSAEKMFLGKHTICRGWKSLSLSFESSAMTRQIEEQYQVLAHDTIGPPPALNRTAEPRLQSHLFRALRTSMLYWATGRVCIVLHSAWPTLVFSSYLLKGTLRVSIGRSLLF